MDADGVIPGFLGQTGGDGHGISLHHLTGVRACVVDSHYSLVISSIDDEFNVAGVFFMGLEEVPLEWFEVGMVNFDVLFSEPRKI